MLTQSESVISGGVDETLVQRNNYHNCGTNMPSGEKQSPVSAKKVTLRDLSSETNNFTSNSLDYSPLKASGSIPDTAKLSGTKRVQPSSPYTPPHSHQHSISSGHLVYVRRKLDTEPSKVCVEKDDHTETSSNNCQKGHSSEIKSQGDHEAKLSAVPSLLSPAQLISSLASEPLPYAKKPGNLMAISSIDQISVSPASQFETLNQGEGYWKERFIRLQMFLKNCDQYNQERYLQSLRLLSATGRSLQAVELEKRAIQLLLDEGRELQKMKVLNVFGKTLPDSQISLSYHAFSPELIPLEK